MLGQDCRDGLLQLPAGCELSPSRPRRRRQAAHSRLGFLQPPLQGGSLALGQRLGADDLHTLGPGVLALFEHCGLRPVKLVSHADEFVVSLDLDQFCNLLTGQRCLYPHLELGRNLSGQRQPGQVEILVPAISARVSRAAILQSPA